MRLTTGLITVAAIFSTLSGPGFAAEADSSASKEPAAASVKAVTPSVNPADTVITVNGVSIKRAELDRTIQAFLSQNRMTAPTDPEQKKKLEEAARNQLVSMEVLYQAAQKEEIADLDRKVDMKFDEGKARFKSAEEFDKALKDNGISVQELKTLLRRDIVINNYIEKQIAGKIVITNEQAKKFYDENLEKFKTPESVKASHILVAVDPKATPEEKEKAKKKADALLTQIKNGADFAELAKKESACPSSANGGDLGSFGRGQMVKPFEDAVFALKQGEVSGVVETQFGYHIIKSMGKTEGGTAPFDQVKAKIEEYLKGQEVQKQVAAKIEELKKTAKIEYSDQKK